MVARSRQLLGLHQPGSSRLVAQANGQSQANLFSWIFVTPLLGTGHWCRWVEVRWHRSLHLGGSFCSRKQEPRIVSRIRRRLLRRLLRLHASEARLEFPHHVASSRWVRLIYWFVIYESHFWLWSIIDGTLSFSSLVLAVLCTPVGLAIRIRRSMVCKRRWSVICFRPGLVTFYCGLAIYLFRFRLC